MKKKTIALLCVLSLAVSGLAAGCGSKDDTPSTKESTKESSKEVSKESSSAAAAESSSAAEEDGPIGNGETLVIARPASTVITDYEENTFTQYVEEMFNVKLDFVLLEDFNTNLSLLLASGDKLPDIVMTGNSGNIDTYNEYGKQGYFIPLEDYYNDPELTPTWSSVVSEEHKKLILDYATDLEGHIYAMCGYNAKTWNQMPQRFFINQSWLDKLGLDMPTTTDELYDVLVAFRDKDPNGNGIKDEIPAYGRFGDSWTDIVNALMNSFVYWNGNYQHYGLALNEDGSTVTAPFTEDGFREGLEYVAKLIDENLLPASVFTDDYNQYKAVLNATPNTVGLVVAGSYGNWSDHVNNENYNQMPICAPFAGPDGLCYSTYIAATPVTSALITSDCENPELAFRLLEAFYDFHLNYCAVYGEEGIDWALPTAEEEEKYTTAEHDGLGYPFFFFAVNDLNTVNQPNNKSWGHVINYTETPLQSQLKSGAVPKEEMRETAPYKNHMAYFAAYPDKLPAYLLPGRLLHEDSQAVSELGNTIKDYVKVALSEFVTGQRSLDDAGWEAYLKELDSMGLEQLIEFHQAAYDKIK